MSDLFEIQTPRSIVLAWVLSHKLITVITSVALCYLGFTLFVTPRVNDNPIQKIKIHGEFPYEKGLTLSLQASFYSRNPTCKQMGRAFLIFPTAEVDRRIAVDLPVTKVGTNQYEAEVALDHISPGFCEWKFGGMSYRILGEKQSDTAYEGLGGVPHHISKATFICKYVLVPKANRDIVFCSNAFNFVFEDKISRTSELNFSWKGE